MAAEAASRGGGQEGIIWWHGGRLGRRASREGLGRRKMGRTSTQWTYRKGRGGPREQEMTDEAEGWCPMMRCESGVETRKGPAIKAPPSGDCPLGFGRCTSVPGPFPWTLARGHPTAVARLPIGRSGRVRVWGGKREGGSGRALRYFQSQASPKREMTASAGHQPSDVRPSLTPP